jgi:hypothetical protein
MTAPTDSHRIAFTRPDGGVTIVFPVPDCGLTLEQIIDRSVPADAPHVILDASDLHPDTDNFFNALTLNTAKGELSFDLDKAKELHKEKLRSARAPKLTELDVAFQRALESGGDTKVVAEQKQELRDVTKHPKLVKAKDVGSIKESWPVDLLGEAPYA